MFQLLVAPPPKHFDIATVLRDRATPVRLGRLREAEALDLADAEAVAVPPPQAACGICGLVISCTARLQCGTCAT